MALACARVMTPRFCRSRVSRSRFMGGDDDACAVPGRVGTHRSVDGEGRCGRTGAPDVDLLQAGHDHRANTGVLSRQIRRYPRDDHERLIRSAFARNGRVTEISLQTLVEEPT